MRPKGIQSRFIRLFIGQIILISIATFAGVFAATKIVESVLLKQALQSEANYFWERYALDRSIDLPNTRNLRTYMLDENTSNSVPAEFLKMHNQYQRVILDGRKQFVYRSKKNNITLYLVFDEKQVSDLIVFFGIVPLIIVLIIIYATTWFAYLQSRRAISPIIKLARLVDKSANQHDKLIAVNFDTVRSIADADVLVLVNALENYMHRFTELLTRERYFTRDASHELRTPLAVMKGSLNLLKNNAHYSDAQAQAITRIQNTIFDMESLLETFLLLSRESDTALPKNNISISALLKKIIDINNEIEGSNMKIELKAHTDFTIEAPEKVLFVLFNNIIRNAINYAKQDSIIIEVKSNSVEIKDCGPGIDKDSLVKIFEPFYRGNDDTKSDGHGLGLAIVQRLVKRFGWSIQAASELGEGTTITIAF